ncbi:polyamine ABC transporter substrate-binding protein [Candidatus Leptofilum sp.]|uniref:polyamine ABC transporter substrate-binding protein n=1 Tax=Candidatus Leptofilum sp. TaxID=3241576 RepID=UPI003B5B48A1
MSTLHKIVGLITLFTLFISLAACRTQTEPTPTPEPEIVVPDTETGSVLNFYNWDTYIDPDILADFEKEFDVTINYQIFDSQEELLAALEAGEVNYDLVVPSDAWLGQMRRGGLLAPLDKANIPNLANLDPAFTNLVVDPGNRYCVPYQWGTVGIGYNASVTGPIESWDDVFDPAHAGRVGLMDDARNTMGLILLSLGYSPNTTDREEIDEAAQFLKDRADIIAAYHGDDGQDLLAEGEFDIVLEWSGDIFQVMEENPDINYWIPTNGSIQWTDFICTPTNAQNKALAETFINYLLEPEVGAALSTYVQYGSPNQAAIPLLDEADRNNLAIYPPAEVRARLFPEAEVDAPTTAYYAAVWEEVLASVE